MAFSILPQFPAHPDCFRAVCAMCFRDAPGEKVIRTDIEHDNESGFYSNVCICESCVTEMGQAIGMLTEPQASAVLAERSAAQAVAAELEERLGAYSHLDAVLQAHANLAPAPVAPEVVEPPTKKPTKAQATKVAAGLIVAAGGSPA